MLLGFSIRQKTPSIGNILKESSKPKLKNKDSKDKKDAGDKKEKGKEDGSESEADDKEDLIENTRLQSIIVSWDDAAIARYFYRYVDHLVHPISMSYHIDNGCIKEFVSGV